MNIRHLIRNCYPVLAALLLTGCVTEDFPECPNDYRLKIVFDRNMLYADAFARQVKSVDIKVFDHETGREVLRHEESGEALASGDYIVTLPIPPGRYDILCWGGMAGRDSFDYADPTAGSLEHQSVTLDAPDGTSRRRLDDLFHGLVSNVSFTDNNETATMSPQTVVMSLTKNTNRLNVILLNLDGSPMDESGFSIRVTSANGEMAFDNTTDAKREVAYIPWHVTPVIAETDLPGVAVQSALSAELSVGRLVDGAVSRLEVWREADGERIISIPLERNLLLYKGEFHSSMSDQEYLDRQDDYTMTFILDKNNNWDRAAMIYINNWATLPVQFQEW